MKEVLKIQRFHVNKKVLQMKASPPRRDEFPAS